MAQGNESEDRTVVRNLDKAYAIVDASQAFDIIYQLEGLGCRFEPVFGNGKKDYEAQTPYLVYLNEHSSETEWFFTEAFGNNWGVVIVTPDEIPVILRDIKKVVWGRMFNATKALLRVYRPLVLNSLIPAISAEKQRTLIGGKVIYAEDSLGQFSLRYQMSNGVLQIAKISKPDLKREIFASTFGDNHGPR